MAKQTLPITQLPNYITKDDVELLQNFVDDVKTNGIKTLKCGRVRILPGEDYEVMPVRITTKNHIYEGEVPLDLDPFQDSDEEMIESIVQYFEEQIVDVKEEEELNKQVD